MRAAVDTSVLLDVFIASVAFGMASRMEAGQAWREYRRRGGQRTAMVPDFLVAAHAVVRADRLLTRDRGFTRKFFRRLRLIDPSET